MQLQEFFDARLKRKTDAVTGRVSKLWQHLVNNQEWMQCPPWQNAALSAHPPAIDAHLFRMLTLRPGSLCPVQIPHEFKTDP